MDESLIELQLFLSPIFPKGTMLGDLAREKPEDLEETDLLVMDAAREGYLAYQQGEERP